MQENAIAKIATKFNLELETKKFCLQNKIEQVKHIYSVNRQKREIYNENADYWDN
jgi:hypothetical protein